MTIDERLELFKNTWGKDALHTKTSQFYIVNLYEKKRKGLEIDDSIETTTSELITRKNNPKYLIFDINQYDILNKYINFGNFTITKNFLNFISLREIDHEYISLCDEKISISKSFEIINKTYFELYLKNLSFRSNINKKTGAIIRDKFKVTRGTKKPTTQAVLSNLGYIIKDSGNDYLEISKNDHSFIKNFVNTMIAKGNYNIKVTESLPLYKEDIKIIVNIGKELLKLTNNKTKIQSFSKKHLGEVRSSLEGTWQLFFEKYLRLFFMSYKSFYSNIVFKPNPGFEKDSIPDFLAVDIYNNIDIIEIKTHRTPLFVKERGRDSIYPASDLTKAVFQLNKYLDLTSDLIDFNKIDDDYTKSLIENNKIYRPRGILIISSKEHIGGKKVTDEIQLRIEKEIKKLKTTYANIDIVLFDELVESLSRYLEQIEISLSDNKVDK